jgi:Arylsulfotransferase (ASST)
MPPRLGALLGVVALTAVLIPATSGGPSAAAEDPRITVGGASRMYPAFDPATTRYAVHAAADGSVTVEVPGASSVRFDGVRDADGAATFSPAPGDEISVFIGEGAGQRAYALYVLPPGFPTLSATTTGAPVQPGNIALTLDRYDRVSPRYEAIVDRRGVPVYTREHSERVLDLKMAANGRFTLHRPTRTPGRTGGALVELDDTFREVRRFETTGLVDTDDHDSLLLPDGSRWLVAYEPDPATGLVDSVIQHVDPSGQVLFEWSSAPHAAETVTPGNADYAHINSLDVQPNGDVLASFRHLSSVFLIASQAHDGHRSGDVIWKLGGRDSDFTFPDGDTGPCAQHAATLLPNGNVLLFDNGSTSFFGNLCVNPLDPGGPAVQRPSSRVVELSLDGDAAGVARTYGATDRFAWFMGSAARTANGNVLIGWSADQTAIASETDAGGSTIWSLVDERQGAGAQDANSYFSYRATLVPDRDGFDPQVAVDGPPDGTTVEVGTTVPVSYSCTDRGGSTLRTCEGPANGRLDTSTAGPRTWTVTATDGAGRTATITRSYTVAESPAPAPGPPPTDTPTPPSTNPPLPPVAAPPGARPDLAVRVHRRHAWVGAGEAWPTAQTAITRPRRPGAVRELTLRVTNAGSHPGRVLLLGRTTLARGALLVTYRARGRSRTRAVAGDGWRTPVLRPGASVQVTVRISTRRTPATSPSTLLLRARTDGGTDRVGVLLRNR